MGKYIERKKRKPSVKERAVTSSILSADIYSLIDSEAVRVDTQYNPEIWPNGATFLRLTSTRELLTDEIRDRILENWREALVILSQAIQDRLETTDITGLCVWQSDYGFDPHSLVFRDKHNVEGCYRW